MKQRRLSGCLGLAVFMTALVLGAVTSWIVKVSLASTTLDSLHESLQRISIVEPFYFVVRAVETGDTDIAMWAIDDFVKQTEDHRDPESNWAMAQAAYDVLVFAFQHQIAEQMGNEELASKAAEQALAAVQASQVPEYSSIRNAESLRSFAENWMNDYREARDEAKPEVEP